jgi:hypothetical protein
MTDFRVIKYHKDIPENAQIFEKIFGMYSNGVLEISVFFREPYQDPTSGETRYASRTIHYLPTEADLEEYEILKNIPFEERLKYNRSIRHWSCSANLENGVIIATTCGGCKQTFPVGTGHTCPAETHIPEELWPYWDFKSHPLFALRYRYPRIKLLQYCLDWCLSKIIPGREQRWTRVWYHGNVFFARQGNRG